jgi:3-deoxy-D-manno-octulosonate 8-phosphate phosphatase (KDO 8-P phosphatase)
MDAPRFPPDLLARAARIRLIGFDVDGRETKRFHVQDGMGLVLLRHAGIEVALVSARRSEVTLARGRELKVARLHVGERSKLDCMRGIAAEMGIGMDQAAFMGDDLPDLAALRDAGLAIAPANAHPWVASAVHWITPRAGGAGAARDACDLLLHAQGKVEAILARGEHP